MTKRHFRIFFHRSLRGGSLLDRVLAKAIKDYNWSFGYGDLAHISHVSVQFDDLYVETLVDGTLVGLINPSEQANFFEQMPRLEAYWEYDISDLTEEAIQAHKFVLHKLEGRKLDIPGCLKYAAELVVADKLGYEEIEEVLASPQAFIRDNDLQYSLPFTCTTPANLLLWKVAEVETDQTSHVAPNLFLTCWLSAGMGAGDFYSLIPMEITL